MEERSGMTSPTRTRVALVSIALAGLLPVIAAPQNPTKGDEEPLVIVKDGRYGYINHSGEIVIEPKYLWGTDFENGFAWVYLCGRMVPIDQSAKILLKRPVDFHALQPKSRDGKVGFVNAAGNYEIQPIFDDALPFSEGLAAVQSGELWGFIDTKGHFAIPPTFDEAYYFHDGVGNVDKRGVSTLIDRAGKVIASGYEFFAGIPHDGRVPVSRDDKFGFLDLHGNVAIPLDYKGARTFSDGLAAVRKETKWGYITTEGQVTIPYEFDDAGPFASGLAPVKIGEDSGFIDKSGKFAFHLEFDYAPGFLTSNADGIFVADSDISRFWTKDHTFGYVNTSGKVIWGPVQGSPDHAPIFGWSEEDKKESCEGVPQEIRDEIAHFPEDE